VKETFANTNLPSLPYTKSQTNQNVTSSSSGSVSGLVCIFISIFIYYYNILLIYNIVIGKLLTIIDLKKKKEITHRSAYNSNANGYIIYILTQAIYLYTKRYFCKEGNKLIQN